MNLFDSRSATAQPLAVRQLYVISQLRESRFAANDKNYRLTKATRTGGTTPLAEGFAYDAVGNRKEYKQGPDTAAQSSDTLTYDPANNQLTGQGAITYAHDDNGHTTSKTQGASTTTYEYNAQERLSSINGGAIAIYRYNAQGQRVYKSVGGTGTFFLYNQNGLAAEYNAAGELQKEYGYAPDSVYMTNPLFMRAVSGAVYAYQNDHLGTPQRLIDNNGSVYWQAQYDAFGKATIQVAAIENNLRFPGQYFDSESGLHQNYFRDYDPGVGRYLERDPIGQLGGLNTFAYVYLNPFTYKDPTGEVAQIVVTVAFAVIVDVATQMATNGGKWHCIKPEETAIAAVMAVVSPWSIGGAMAKATKANKAMAKSRQAKAGSRTANRNAKKEATQRSQAQGEASKAAATEAAAYGTGKMIPENCGC